MFHVSTFLPYSTKNDQQVERKKHIGNTYCQLYSWNMLNCILNRFTGNDVCVIIFQEDNQCIFTPTNITSDFNHVFVVVREETEEDTQPDGATTTTSTSNPAGNDSRGNSRGSSRTGSRTSSQNNIEMDERDLIGGIEDTAASPSEYENGDNADDAEDECLSAMDRDGKDEKDKEKEKDDASSEGDDMSMGSGGVGLVKSPDSRRGSNAGTNGNNWVGPRTRYRIAIAQKEGVPPYGPLIVYPPVYEAVMPRFRSTMLKKRTYQSTLILC